MGLIHKYCLIRFNISNKYNDCGFNNLQINNFTKSELESKFYLNVEYFTLNLGSSCEALYPKYYIPSSKVIGLLVLNKKIFKGFYHTWACRPSRSCDQTVHLSLEVFIWNLPNVFSEKYVLTNRLQSIMSDLAERSKVNIDL